MLTKLSSQLGNKWSSTGVSVDEEELGRWLQDEYQEAGSNTDAQTLSECC